jgi:hypothetical protein
LIISTHSYSMSPINSEVYWHKPAQSIAAVASQWLMGFILLSAFATSAFPQTKSVTIQVVPAAAIVRVEGVSDPRTTWSFRDVYAGVVGLGSRIRNFEVFDKQGARLTVRTLAPGQFESAAPATRFKYELNLTPPLRPSDAAFVSWLSNDRGILLPADLLPVTDSARVTNAKDARIELRVNAPQGWSAYANEKGIGESAYDVADSDRAVIFVAKNLRTTSRAIRDRAFTFVTNEAWAFSDAEAIEVAAKVIEVHSEVAGALPCAEPTLLLLPFAGAANQWTAQTRGCTATLLVGKQPSKTAALAQLGNALTHELFHLWIPNGLALTGDYDWFYEGFTMYQAARVAVQLGFVSFPEFMNAIARAYDGASAAPEAQRLSLIDASKQRWTGGAASVYSKAMVVAFLYDLNLRFQSKGKRSLDDIYRKMSREHLRKNSEQREADGNAAVVALLKSEASSPGFVERFIAAPVVIDLQKELTPFGFRVEKFPVRTHVSIADDLNGRQRDLLKQLGYNEPRTRKK